MQRPPVVVAAVVAFVVMEVVVAVGVVAVVVVVLGEDEVALVPGLLNINISSILCGYQCRSVSFRR